MIHCKSELFPIGRIGVYSADGAVCRICITDEALDDPDDAVNEALKQLHEYFDGKRSVFDFEIRYISGTEFQRKIWDILREIPYGETASYKDIAVMAGNPKATRAVGNANGKNPLMIVNPCHRVIASDGSIGGYFYGTEMKIMLLELEKNNKEKFL